MDTREAITLLRKRIAEEIFRQDRKHVHENEIKQLIAAINDDLLNSYEKQREFISQILFVYEEYPDHFISNLFTLFLNGMNDIKSLRTEQLDLSFWEKDFDIDVVYKDFKVFLEQNMRDSQAVRLSHDLILIGDVSKSVRYLQLIHKLISHQSIRHTISADDVTGVMLQLWMARNIARAIDRKELFYFLTSIFLDGLHHTQNYQFARDIAEECLICAYKDGMPEYGYYLSFKVFAATSSSITALHYALVANTAFMRKGVLSDYVLKNYFWEAIKFARNIKLIPFAISLFENRPLNVSYSIYENNKLHHAYYSSLFYLKDKQLPGQIINYIDKTKEDIIETGEHEVLPWLSLLLTIKKNYSSNDYDAEHTERYIELFRRIVTPQNYDKIHTTLFGELNETSAALRKALLSLSFTRNPSDFITDNKLALQVSHRNILQSFHKEDVEAYLLSMILQSDFSIVFKDKETQLIMPIHESYKSKNFEEEYYTPAFLKSFIQAHIECDILWLGTDNHKILPLYYCNQQFSFLNDRVRNLIDAFTYARDNIKYLPLKTRTEKGAEKLFEDYAQEESFLKKDISFLSLPIQPEQPLLLIKDIESSAFPHNLITTQNDFVSNLVPVCNVMSLEWLIETTTVNLPSHPSTSIWIPIESGDCADCYDACKNGRGVFKIQYYGTSKDFTGSAFRI